MFFFDKFILVNIILYFSNWSHLSNELIHIPTGVLVQLADLTFVFDIFREICINPISVNWSVLDWNACLAFVSQLYIWEWTFKSTNQLGNGKWFQSFYSNFYSFQTKFSTLREAKKTHNYWLSASDLFKMRRG